MENGYYSSFDHGDELCFSQLRSGQSVTLTTEKGSIALRVTNLLSPRMRPLVKQIVDKPLLDGNPYYELIGDTEVIADGRSTMRARTAQGALTVGRSAMLAVYARGGEMVDLGSVIHWSVFAAPSEQQALPSQTEA